MAKGKAPDLSPLDSVWVAEFAHRCYLCPPNADATVLWSQHDWFEAEDVIVAELNLDLIRNQRRQEPIFRGFRPELYEPRAS